jgi:hypothetical protein
MYKYFYILYMYEWGTVNTTAIKIKSSACYLLYPGFLLSLSIDAEDGDMFLRNVG